MQENIPELLELGDRETSAKIGKEENDHRETSANIGAEVLGREKEKEEIMALLSGSITQEITFLHIYGIGGIGKTTMAQSVFNDSQFKEYSRVWIYVSQTFDLKKIGNAIITQLSGNKSEHTELQLIENSLQKLLSHKRVLVILDDLWEREKKELQKMKSMLSLGEGGKVVVVVTTREFIMREDTDKVKQYRLAPLTDDICWAIIRSKNSFESRDDREELELVGKEIAKKCGDVALAAQSIGYMLENMEFDGWVSVNNSEIWDVLASGESSSHHVHASLLLSYDRMDKYLKLCFAYCAIFPKGHMIATEHLARQWIALGLVEPSRIFSDMQTSNQYIRRLFGMCFLEDPKSLEIKRERFLIMHDLVHDLARSVLGDEVNIESPACQYAWLTDHRKLFYSSTIPLAKIRTLHFIDRGYLQLLGQPFSSANCLCVLDLSRCCADVLPDSIGQLKQLRYLDASWNRDFTRIAPESILIPEALCSLNKLQYLNLSNRPRSIGLPEVISKLTELRYLNISYCQGYYLLDNPSANQSFIDCIGTLPNLEQLDMSSNQYDFCVPESFSRLKKLNLRGCYSISSLPEIVTKLDKKGLFGLLQMLYKEDAFPVCEVDSESSSSLVWLKHTNPDVLRIVDLENVKSVEEARSIRLMAKWRIEELSLQWGYDFVYRENMILGYVEHMKLLTELMPPSSVMDFKIEGYKGDTFPHWFMHISKYLPNLVSLELTGFSCSSLPTLVQHPNLCNIVLRDMHNLEEFNMECFMGDDGAELEYLHISYCQKLRFKSCLPRVAIWDIHQSDDVLLSWGDCAASTAASSSYSPVSKLEVETEDLPLHQWRLLQHLPGLSDLTIYGCCDMRISPQVSRALTSLKVLSLHGLDQEKLPEWLGELTSLRQLNLEYYDKLQEFHENMRTLTKLQMLSLDYCKMMTSLPQWLGELPLLEILEIRSCEGIISLPESILTNLQVLHISGSPKLYEWCMLEENQEKLAHINEKFIYKEWVPKGKIVLESL